MEANNQTVAGGQARPYAIRPDAAQLQQARAELVEKVLNYFEETKASTAIDSINDTLYYWLVPQTAKPEEEPADLTQRMHRNQLYSIIRLVSFLSRLQESANWVFTLEALLEATQQEGGPKHE